MAHLTPAQAIVFNCIKIHIKENNGNAPTIRELAEKLECAQNNIQGHLKRLVNLGACTDGGGKSRSIRPVKGFKFTIKESVHTKRMVKS